MKFLFLLSLAVGILGCATPSDYQSSTPDPTKPASVQFRLVEGPQTYVRLFSKGSDCTGRQAVMGGASGFNRTVYVKKG
jgi:hypothetical protein